MQITSDNSTCYVSSFDDRKRRRKQSTDGVHANERTNDVLRVLVVFVYFRSSSFVPLCSSSHKKFEIYWTPTKLACFSIEGVGGRTAMFSDSLVTRAVNKTRGIEMNTLRRTVFQCFRLSDHLKRDLSRWSLYLDRSFVRWSAHIRNPSVLMGFSAHWFGYQRRRVPLKTIKRIDYLFVGMRCAKSSSSLRQRSPRWFNVLLEEKPLTTTTTDNQIIASTRSSFDQRCLVFTVASIELIRKKHSSRRLSQSMLIGNRTTNRNLSFSALDKSWLKRPISVWTFLLSSMSI